MYYKKHGFLQKNKVVYLVLFCILLTIFMISFIAVKGSSASEQDPFIRTSENGLHFYNSTEEELGWILTNSGDVIELETRNTDSICFSMDTSKACYLSNNDLYYASNAGFYLVTGNVTECKISMDGKYIVYLQNMSAMTQADQEYQVGELFYYDTSTHRTTKLDEQVFSDSFVISPSGTCVAYSVADDSGKGSALYVAAGKNNKFHITSNATPIAIADEAKYLYYIKNDKILYVQKGEDLEKLGVAPSEIYFNEDYSEMIFATDNKVYISVNGGLKKKLNCEPNISFFAPTNITSYSANLYPAIGVNSFAGKVISCSKNANYYIHEDFSLEKFIVGDIVQMSEDGNSMVYLKAGDLYKIFDLSKSIQSVKISNTIRAVDFTCNRDLSEIYFQNNVNELIYISKDGDEVLITEEMGDSGHLVSNWENNSVYFTDNYPVGEKDLYYSQSGSPMKTVLDSNGVEFFENFGNCISYRVGNTDQGFDIYIIKSGTRSEKVLNNVKLVR